MSQLVHCPINVIIITNRKYTMNELLEEYYITYFVNSRCKNKCNKQKSILCFLPIGVKNKSMVEKKLCDYLIVNPKDYIELHNIIKSYLFDYGVQRSKHKMFEKAVFDDVKHVLKNNHLKK